MSSFRSNRERQGRQRPLPRSSSSSRRNMQGDEDDDKDDDYFDGNGGGGVANSNDANDDNDDDDEADSEPSGEYEMPLSGVLSSPSMMDGTTMLVGPVHRYSSSLSVSDDSIAEYDNNNNNNDDDDHEDDRRLRQYPQRQRQHQHQQHPGMGGNQMTPMTHNRSLRSFRFVRQSSGGDEEDYDDDTGGGIDDDGDDYDDGDDVDDGEDDVDDGDDDDDDANRRSPKQKRERGRTAPSDDNDDDDVNISPLQRHQEARSFANHRAEKTSKTATTAAAAATASSQRSPLPIRLPVYDIYSNSSDDSFVGDLRPNKNKRRSNQSSVSFNDTIATNEDISSWSKSPASGRHSVTSHVESTGNANSYQRQQQQLTMQIRNRGSMTHLTEVQKASNAMQFGIPSPGTQSHGTLGYSVGGHDSYSHYSLNDHAGAGHRTPLDDVFVSPTSTRVSYQTASTITGGGLQHHIEEESEPLPRTSGHTVNTTMSAGITVNSGTTIHNGSNHSGIQRENRKEAFRRVGSATRDAGDDDGASSVGSESVVVPIVLCGVTCSTWLSRMVRNPFSLYRISLCIVTWAPCFWFWCCNKNDLQGGASSDRFILARLNTIIFFFTMMQLVGGAWLATVLFWIYGQGALEMFSPHLWNVNGAAFAVGIIGALVMVTCFYTVRIIKEVDLVGAIRYLWFILWITPVEVFFTITLFDYHNVTSVWVAHWWTSDQLTWFRERYCTPGTANTLCMVPVNGGPNYDTEDGWCIAQYDSIDCTVIRDDAQSDTTLMLLIFYTALASWGCVLLFLLLLVVNSLERIISKPIVQKSRETNVPGWLALPTIATALTGAVFLYSPSSVLQALKQQKWIGILYITSSGLFLVALLMGWLLSVYSIRSNVDKRNKSSAVILFIAVQAINALLLATIFVSSIIWSTDLDLTDGERGDVACVVHDTDCSRCNATLSSEKCPEWTVDEVTSILRTQLKQSAALAAIFILYALNVMGYGIVLRRHLRMYQIDYV